MASEKLGVHQIYIVFGLGFLVTAFLFFGFGAGLLWCVCCRGVWVEHLGRRLCACCGVSRWDGMGCDTPVVM